MKNILIGCLVALGLGIGVGAAAIYGGYIDVAADTPHSPAVYRLIETARDRAIERSSRDIVPPGDLADRERVRRGAGNYDAMCVSCHLAPGMENSEIRQGLYPTPPNLARQGRETGNPAPFLARQFWVIKHGIKASGMPAWSKGGVQDGHIWDLVAFLQQLPALTPEQYRQWVAKSDGHSHGGVEDHHAEPAGQEARPGDKPKKPSKPHHDHSSHKHAH